MSIYDFKAKSISGKNIDMSDYKGKVLLIVNTASKWGLTPQLKELEELYMEYKDRGFEVLAFPSNQFGNQEPGTNEEILKFAQSNYGVTFEIFEKSDVKGDTANPIFSYLVSQNKPRIDISIHASTRGATFTACVQEVLKENFNPRTYTRCDIMLGNLKNMRM